jgi:hypothetical protein
MTRDAPLMKGVRTIKDTNEADLDRRKRLAKLLTKYGIPHGICTEEQVVIKTGIRSLLHELYETTMKKDED